MDDELLYFTFDNDEAWIYFDGYVNSRNMRVQLKIITWEGMSR